MSEPITFENLDKIGKKLTDVTIEVAKLTPDDSLFNILLMAKDRVNKLKVELCLQKC